MATPLRVILNDRPLRTTLTGVGHYIREILLQARDSTEPVTIDPFLFGRILRRDVANAGAAPPPAANPTATSRGVGTSRKPWWLRRMLDAGYNAAFRFTAGRGRRYNLYHEPNHIPIRTALPTVTTIHDLSVIVHPEWHPTDRVAWYEHAFAAGCRQTTRFIAASEYTRQQMIAHCGLPADQIDVTYQAPRAAFHPPTRDAISTLRRIHDLPDKFFLYVGTLEPRKNLPGLLDAFATLPASTRREHPLVIVGAWGWKQEALREKLAQRDLTGQVRLLGYMADQQLATLYAACTAFVWPTLFEGFGMPPLEAMACGGPVIVSNVTSLPEVVADAGVLLDPHDPGPWTATMQRMAEDPAWRAAWIERGRARAATFSWQRCLSQTLDCYRRAVQS